MVDWEDVRGRRVAKYELLKDDPHMCIVFVGVAPTYKRFPAGVDEAVSKRIAELRRESRLQDVVDTGPAPD